MSKMMTNCQHTNTVLVYPNTMEFSHTNEKCNDCKRIVAVNTGAVKVVGR